MYFLKKNAITLPVLYLTLKDFIYEENSHCHLDFKTPVLF